MSFFEVFILSFIEGLTEFIPVSSTGHLIIFNKVLGISPNEYTKAFDVIIQFGAIAAVLVIYQKKFRFNFEFYKKLFIGFIPAAILGFLLKEKISILMESTAVVAWSLIIGGLIMILTDIKLNQNQDSDPTLIQSLKIGLFQSLALIPGVSRSASTIIGGQLVGLNKKRAAEFSFFLAVPTLAAATVYKLYKIKNTIHPEQISQLLTGTILSFIFALFALKFFMNIVQKYGFKWFGIYRVLIGLLVLLFIR